MPMTVQQGRDALDEWIKRGAGGLPLILSKDLDGGCASRLDEVEEGVYKPGCESQGEVWCMDEAESEKVVGEHAVILWPTA